MKLYRICRDAGRLCGVLDVLVADRGGMAFRMDGVSGARPVEVSKAAAEQIAAAIGDCFVRAKA